jgi:hypothetical protein
MVEVQVLTLPLLSVTVKVTVLGPMLAQVNEVLSRLSERIPQASLEPLSTCWAVIEAAPAASSCMVSAWQIAIGATLSSTVMVEVQVLTFPLLSVTVKVTVLGPTLAQVNDVLSRLSEAIPQASLDPLSTCSGVMEATPDASS